MQRRQQPVGHQVTEPIRTLLHFPSATAFKVGLHGRGFGIRLQVLGPSMFAMSKSNRGSIILLSIYSGIPLLFCIVVIALIMR